MLISVIMATYNAEKMVEESLLSFFEQNYAEKEIIIIDGASTDRTVEIINKYLDKIAVFVSEPDEGIHDAINKGIARAHGAIIGFLNAGDWYANDHVLSCIASEFSPDTDVYSASIIKQVDGSWRLFNSDENLSLLYRYCSVHWLASFFKNNVFDNYGTLNNNLRIAGDYDYFLTLYENQAKFQFSECPIVIMTDGGVSSDLRKGGHKEALDVQRAHGVPALTARTLYYRNMIKDTFIQILRLLNLEDAIRRILSKENRKMSNQELANLGIDIQNPWFLNSIDQND